MALTSVRSRILITALLLALPMIASAEQQTMLTLNNRTEQAQWNTIGLPHVSLLPNGIHIQTNSQKGTLSRPLSLSHGVDVVTVYYTSPRGASLSFIWQSKGSAAGTYLQIPVTLKPSSSSTSIIVDMSAIGGWDPHASAIGFQLPPDTDIVFHGIELQGWSVAEKLSEAVKCFWTFDGLTAHSINFFWGPLLCSTPVSRTALFHNQPPIAHSGMRTIYALLAVGVLIITFRAWRKRDEHLPGRILAGSAALFFVCWIFLDIRMSAELIATWTYDVRSYLLQPVGKRTFRKINFLSDFALASRGIVADQPRYVFLAPTTDTFMNFMRYQTYPSEPVGPAGGSGASLWLVYERPDLQFSTDGRIVEKGVPISPVGQIVHEFMNGTFIFRVTPPQPATGNVPPVPSSSKNKP
ncbi:MAG: hypothetical protein PHX87_00760 [Candidatus Peribacteraceae bacterium]|nr:hypothetical protein [Candidatus Peribacteraceae bacterium]MDD5741939.1 hypothetical protein [Candidatus Peribacteraceae bacterium]